MGGGVGLNATPSKVFILEDKTSAPDVFSSCSFMTSAHFESSSLMVSFCGYEISRHKYEVIKPFLSESTCFFNSFQ